MQTRKGWRNRDASAGESVQALLGVLREGLGAQSVGLFDDDRFDASGNRSPPNFWEAFDPQPCGAIDWDAWYRELRLQQRVDSACGCGGQHRLRGFLLHDRWALLVVTPPAIAAGGAAAIVSSLRALGELLPPGPDQATRDAAAYDHPDAQPDAQPNAGDPSGPPAGPLWWVRKPPH